MRPSHRVAIAAVIATLTAACSGTATPPSPSDLITVSPSIPATPNPSVSPLSQVQPSRWTEVWGLDVVTHAFLVTTVASCHGTPQHSSCAQHVSASQDGGRTWYDITPPIGNSETNLGTPDFIDPDHGWIYAGDCVGGKGTLWGTLDGGAIWHPHTDVVTHTCNAGADVAPIFADAEHGWLLHDEPTGGSSDLYFSRDGGKTWRQMTTPQPTDWVIRAGFTSAETGWVAGWVHGHPALFRSELTGSTWDRVKLALPSIASVGRAYAGVPTAFGDVLIEPIQVWRDAHLSVIFDRSDDGGSTWRRVRTVQLARDVSHPRGPFPLGWVSIGSPETFFVSAGHAVTRSDPSGDRVYGWGGRDLEASGPDVVWALRGHRKGLVRIDPSGAHLFRPWPPSAHPLTLSARPVGMVPPGSRAVLGTSSGSLYLASAKGRWVFRVDPSTGHVVARIDLGHGGELSAVASDGSVWVAQRGDHRRGRLLKLDAGTLEIRARRRVLDAARGLAVTGSQIWFGSGDRLIEIDADRGVAIAPIGLGSRIDRLAGDAGTSRLYLTLQGPVRHDQPPLLELDGTTGTVLARTHAGFADLNGVSQLVPTPDGVWAAEPSGMMGTLSLYRRDGLAKQGFPEGREGRGQIYGSNAIEGSYASGYLFVGYPSGLTSCVGARTGQRLGVVGAPRQGIAPPIVDVGGRPMAVAAGTLYLIDPQAACR